MTKQGLICDLKDLKITRECIYSDIIIAGKYVKVRLLDKSGIGMNKGLKDNYILYPLSEICSKEDRIEVEILLKELKDAREIYNTTKSYITQRIKTINQAKWERRDI